MAKLALTDVLLIDPEGPEGGEPSPGTLLLEKGRIAECVSPQTPLGEDWQRVSRPGLLVAPGFIDLHFHGELVVARPEAFAGCLDRAARAMAARGTTAFLATTLAWSPSDLLARVGALVDVITASASASASGSGPGSSPGSSSDSRSRAACLGLHLEGPWLSSEAPGAMAPDCIRPFEPARDGEVLARAGDCLRMVTLAPEAPGADALLDALAARNVLAALGHTRAGAEDIDRAIARGARHVTHLFNAMGPIHHREPGVAAELMTRDALHCDLICDGHHVHPTMVGLAARVLGERLVLITDRVDYQRPEHAAENGQPIRLPDGTLAGSQLGLDRAIGLARRHGGLALRDAVAACTLRPARLLGIEAQRGTLRAGARADLALLDASGEVQETWIAGLPA